MKIGRKDIRENSPEDIKQAFGDFFLGADKDISMLQGKGLFSKTEKNTELEEKLINILGRWVLESTPKLAKDLYDHFDLLKRASEIYPSVLKPSKPNGSPVYRGIRILSKNFQEQLLRASDDDWDWDEKAEGWRYKKTINYAPTKLVQSWTYSRDTARLFSAAAFLETKQSDDFLFNEKLMYAVGLMQNRGVDEQEILHFGKNFKNDVYFMLGDYHYKAFRRKRLLSGITEVKTIEDVHAVAEAIPISNYTVNSDLSVDVEQTVFFDYSDVPYMKKLPIKFRKVSSGFYCANLGLTTLENCPEEVDGNFSCKNNNLTSLVGGPKKVRLDYNCSNNQLTSLKGIPREVESVIANNNKLKTLEGSPEIVNGVLAVDRNPLVSFKGIPKKLRVLYIPREMETKENLEWLDKNTEVSTVKGVGDIDKYIPPADE